MTDERVKIAVRGVVQGVGFRPFVHRLATELGLAGFVANSPQGARIEVEGPCASLDRFLTRLERERPPRAAIHGLERSRLDPRGYSGFTIRASEAGGAKSAFVSPDIATCADCLRELFDPGDRRHRYPFINCTNCGPRYSILEALPYDRPNTSMKRFTMCAACEREYRDPRDRRHHAQPNACPACGPRVSLPIEDAAAVLRAGGILALKGIGGFQLLADAGNDAAVRRLRARKRREEKPFALLYPTLADVKGDCRVSELEERLLLSPEAPIV
ncbi:MAG: acylphosphatase, partial [Candidatus Methylomirabilis sp.]|nr:acylphosphatase [Deltaproteobacteria bacterium]